MAGRYSSDDAYYKVPMRPANRLDFVIIFLNLLHNIGLSFTTLIRETLGVLVGHYHYKDYENEQWQMMTEELEQLEGEQ
jgi:hypothetical protein